MKRYNPSEIEPKWQKVWAETGIYEAHEDRKKSKKYILDFFPYASGASMHVGHVRNYTISDALARFARQRGQNVLHPMGWDEFGLPAENYAIKTGVAPQESVKKNTGHFKRQLTQMGIGLDWTREFGSSDPTYYKWTQWLFTVLFERGLAYQKESLQWWCDTDKTVLANEQVEAGRCWRCGNKVTKKPLKQWFFKITDYADRLADDLEGLDWSDAIKSMQRNWIGKSKGAEIAFKIADSTHDVKIFTTRPDTLFGATFMVLAPEHPLLKQIVSDDQRQHVDEYIEAAIAKSDVDRMDTEREKTGVPTGAHAINPVNGQKIPIWVADYVLMGYGTGAIMAVPAHDERDFAFAEKFSLPIIKVVEQPADTEPEHCYHGDGIMVNSEVYDGLSTAEAREKIVADLHKKKIGREHVNYKIRDWLISRQRYWGAPIPIVHCDIDGQVAVPVEQLPVELPAMKSYEPSGDGRSPLARVSEWVNTACPTCGGPATRETDTMDGFACSSWYFLRFADPHNNKAAFDADKIKYWLPVDTYIGGAEHAVMHLLYARFWTKVMHDAGLIDFDEPFTSLKNHGMIWAPDGRKMSKSFGNTIAPDDLIADGYGADAIRLMELFIAPWNQGANWSTEGLGGCYRFLQRSWTVSQEYLQGKDLVRNPELETRLTIATHKAIKKVTEDLHTMGFNTAIAALMEFVNELYKIKIELPPHVDNPAWREALATLAQLLAPFAPHIAEEMWSQLGNDSSVHVDHWPTWDEAYLIADVVTVVVQVNGKLRAKLDVPADASEEEVTSMALSHEKIATFVGDKKPAKIIYVPARLVNIVVR